MGFANYLRSSLWDFILVLLASIGLGYTLLDAFYIAPAIQYSPLPALVCLIATVFLFLIAYNGRTALPGGIAYGIVAIGAIIIAAAVSPVDNFLIDTEANYFYFMLVMVASATATYFLSRKRLGTALFFIIGTFICVVIQFFYEFFEFPYFLIFLFASIALIVYRNYQQSAVTATSLERISFPAGFLTALAATVLSILLGCGVWFGIIAPLHPDKIDLKLIVEYWALETEMERGASNVYQEPNTDMRSTETYDSERTVDDLWEQEGGTEIPSTPKTVQQNEREGQSGSFLGINLDSLEDVLDFISYNRDLRYLWLLLLLIPLAIIVYFVGRIIYRRIRLAGFRRGSPDEQASSIYTFLVDRFGRIGIGIAPGLTLYEYAGHTASSMRFHDEGMQQPFTALTKTYTENAYGERAVTQEEADSFAGYYRHFWKASRKYLGNLRYFIRSFRL